MKFLEEHWYLMIGAAALCGTALFAIFRFRRWIAAGMVTPKRLAISLGAVIAFATLLFIAIKGYESSSDSFNAARDFLNSSADVRSQIGEIVSVEAPIFGDYEEDTENGTASMELTVKGLARVASAEVELVVAQGKWCVVRASVNGQPIAVPGRYD